MITMSSVLWKCTANTCTPHMHGHFFQAFTPCRCLGFLWRQRRGQHANVHSPSLFLKWVSGLSTQCFCVNAFILLKTLHYSHCHNIWEESDWQGHSGKSSRMAFNILPIINNLLCLEIWFWTISVLLLYTKKVPVPGKHNIIHEKPNHFVSWNTKPPTHFTLQMLINKHVGNREKIFSALLTSEK